MTKNAKVILSAAGIVAALASPVLAKTSHQASVRDAPVQTVYAPDVPVQPHTGSINRDFQLGSEKN
jgi:hypothetical protein